MQMDSFLTLKGSNVELVGAPETIFVLPIGHVVSSKGEFDVDDESYGKITLHALCSVQPLRLWRNRSSGGSRRGPDRDCRNGDCGISDNREHRIRSGGNRIENHRWRPGTAGYLCRQQFRWVRR